MVCFKLVIEKDRYNVQIKGISIVIMNKRIYLGFKSLSFVKEFKYISLLLRMELYQRLTVVVKLPSLRSPKLIYTIAILVFNLRFIVDIFVKDFSRYYLFFQHLYPMSIDIFYKNLQYFDMVGYPFFNGSVLVFILAELFQRDSDLFDEPDEDKAIDFVIVMDNLPKYDYF